MKLGISIGHAGARMELPLARIQRAEDLGFDSVRCGRQPASGRTVAFS